MIPNKIYITEDHRILLSPPEDGATFFTYISYPYLEGLLDNIKVLGGESANRYIDSQIDGLKSLDGDISEWVDKNFWGMV
jgi:hypothetical protein